MTRALFGLAVMLAAVATVVSLWFVMLRALVCDGDPLAFVLAWLGLLLLSFVQSMWGERFRRWSMGGLWPESVGSGGLNHGQ